MSGKGQEGDELSSPAASERLLTALSASTRLRSAGNVAVGVVAEVLNDDGVEDESPSSSPAYEDGMTKGIMGRGTRSLPAAEVVREDVIWENEDEFK